MLCAMCANAVFDILCWMKSVLCTYQIDAVVLLFLELRSYLVEYALRFGCNVTFNFKLS